ncbi:MAG: hypothetical protein WCR20_24030, partial [Verrucomicrobiota bacterium]
MTVDQRQQTIAQAKREFESIRLDAAAYSTAKILIELQTPNAGADPASFRQHIAAALVSDKSFTPEQASAFVERYTPLAAFDKEGAGIVFFKDTVTGTIIPTTRGTDLTGNALNDVLSDTAIAQNRLPTYQTTLLINFGLQVTAPEGTLVPQFRVVGITSSLDDAIAATITTMLPLNPYANPQYEIAGYVRGTGQAVGTCVNSTGHSEAAPQAQVIGAILGCTSPNAYNGPGVSVAQMQGALDAAMDALHQPRVSLPVPDSLVIGSAGPSPIASVNGGLPGQQSTLPIDWSINPLNYFDNHGVVKGMNAAELRLKLIEADPSIQTMAQANAALIEAQRSPGSIDALASLDPTGNYQPGMDTSAASATGTQADNAAGGNVT